MLRFDREEKFEILQNGDDSFDEKPSHILTTVVAEGLWHHDTVVGYVIKNSDGKIVRRWEWWLF